MSKHVLTVFTDGLEEVEGVTVVDLLRRAGLRVTVAGLEKTQIRGSHDIEITADTTLDRVQERFDALVLPGGPGTGTLAGSQKLLQLVRESFSQGLLCAAICAAPSVLDKAGILTGKQYTCFPGVKISEGTPEEATVVRDGNLITSRGVGTAIPFALAIIDYLQGKETADAIADKIVYAGPR